MGILGKDQKKQPTAREMGISGGILVNKANARYVQSEAAKYGGPRYGQQGISTAAKPTTKPITKKKEVKSRIAPPTPFTLLQPETELEKSIQRGTLGKYAKSLAVTVPDTTKKKVILPKETDTFGGQKPLYGGGKISPSSKNRISADEIRIANISKKEVKQYSKEDQRVIKETKKKFQSLPEKTQKSLTTTVREGEKKLNRDLYTGFGSSPAQKVMKRATEFGMEALSSAALGIPDALTGHTLANRADYEKTGYGTAGKLIGDILPVGGAYKVTAGAAKAVEKGAEKLLPKIAGSASKTAKLTKTVGKSASRGLLAGTTYQTAQEAADAALDTRNDRNQTLGQRAENVGKTALMFAGGDVGLSALGKGILAARSASEKGLLGGKVRGEIPSINKPPITETNAASNITGIAVREAASAAEQITPTQTTRGPILANKGVAPAEGQITPRERGFVQTLEESGKLTPEVTQGLKKSTERTYEPITNIETVQKANQRIAQGIDKAESDLIGKSRYNAEDVATGMRLIDELQKTGQTVRAVTIAENLSKRLTEAGQTVQAASIWNRLTPEGALLAAQRKVNSINENLLKGQTPVKINEQQAQTIQDAATAIQASGASKERAGTVMEIMDRVRKGEEVAAADKQILADFIADAKRFIKPADTRPPRPASIPKEMGNTRVRDRVTSFLESQEQAAKERLRAKGIQISANPIDAWADYAYIGALKLAKGTIKFADFSEQMIIDLGEGIRPHLRNIYEKSQEVLNQSTKKINEQVISKAERLAENFLKSNESKVSNEDINLIRDIAQRVSSLSGAEQRYASQELQAVLNGFEKAGVGRKLASAQYISMLLNPKTQVRNIGGNELMYRLERLQRLISTPIDIAVSKITGKPRTITFKSGPSVWDDFFTTSKDYFSGFIEGAKAGARGVSPEGLMSKYEIGGLAFTSKYNPLTYAEKALGAVMKGADFAAYQRATNQRMREMAYLDAINKGIKGDDAIRNHMQTFMTNVDDSVHNIAKEYGRFSTLQNDSILSRKLMGFRRGLNVITIGSKEFGLGSLVVPFAKTPANLLLRGLDYSPIGILKATKQAYDVLKKPNTDLTRADVIQSVSRALMGTGMGALAYWLADKGAMFGQSNADPEVRKLMQQTGIKDFQINGSALSRMFDAITTGGNVDVAAKIRPGDTLWSYEWAQPTSMPMAIGSNIYQGTKKDQDILKTTGEAAASGLGTLFNSSVLSGIREAFQIPPGEDNAIKAIGLNLVKQTPGMFTPSILRNINTYLDNRIKETYNPDDLQAILSPAAANIPGLSQQLPQRVTTLGKPQIRPNNFFDVFVSPSDRSKYEPSKEAQFVIDLMQATGDIQLAPRAVQKYLIGKDIKTGVQKKVDLTPEQYVRLQTIVGQETAKRILKINQNLPTDKKVSAVIKALNEAGKIGRNELKKEIGIKPAR